MNETIPGLEIEPNDDGTFSLEQNWGGNIDRVAIHPLHVRHLAEKTGLIRTVLSSEAEMEAALRHQIQTLEKDAERLQSAMLCIRDRAEQLFRDLCLQNDRGHEDLNIEVTKCAALTDIIALAVKDFAEDWTSDEQPTYGKRDTANADKSTTGPALTQAEPAGVSSGATTDWALRQPLDKSSTKFVLFAMAWKAGGIGRCCASTADISEMTGQDRKTVMENIKRLSEIGLITDTGEKGEAPAMSKIKLLAQGLNVAPLLWALQDHPELWNQQTARTESPDSPHHGLSDIWARYADPKTQQADGSHDSIWYPPADVLPVKDLVYPLMEAAQADRLTKATNQMLREHRQAIGQVIG